jgi:hypothetical protein
MLVSRLMLIAHMVWFTRLNIEILQILTALNLRAVFPVYLINNLSSSGLKGTNDGTIMEQ